MRLALVLFLVFAQAACAAGLPVRQAGRPPVADVGVGERPQAIPHARVHFATARDRVRRRDVALVVENARWLTAHPGAMVVLEGHCDERGGDDFNLALGDRRARSVKAMLVQAGVGDERPIIVVSAGERRPLDTRHRPAAWAKNRRVEFVIP